jgi:hypothetical protein
MTKEGVFHDVESIIIVVIIIIIESNNKWDTLCRCG